MEPNKPKKIRFVDSSGCEHEASDTPANRQKIQEIDPRAVIEGEEPVWVRVGDLHSIVLKRELHSFAAVFPDMRLLIPGFEVTICPRTGKWLHSEPISHDPVY